MFCSTIIPTINRPTLARAVTSVLDQGLYNDEFEVIVVNDSGQALPGMAWQQSPRVQVLNTNQRERCVARNAGAAIARGKYLHFLDDDDMLLPGAFNAFWELDQSCEAIWLYGSYQSVDNNDRLIEEFHPGLHGNIFAQLVSGEGIPFQASLLDAKHFHAVGAFDLTSIIVGVEDRDVGRRMALAGPVAYTPTVVAKIRIGQTGSTTNWTTIAEGDRWGREKALSAHTAFSRLHASVDNDYWRGRVSRAYFASMLWNLKHRNTLTATSRALGGLSFSSLHLPSASFWKGLCTKVK
jgi:glycosyltransferase involved in cell wall biosynthesis